MKNGCIILIFFLFVKISYAQKESHVWYFGNKAGLDFRSGAPVAVQNDSIAVNTIEGCATLCDSQGNLLFYTDGISVWNKKHQLMANGAGLMGNFSSTQSAVIAPQPGSDQLYYIFTVDNNARKNGLRYSLVDIKQENGLGQVISKNTPLITPVTEKVTAVRHGNKEDIWVITHLWDSDAFYAYLLTDKGIVNVADPVISHTGVVHGGDNTNSIGYMKASPDGSKIALGIRLRNTYELLDFDDTTGKISKPVTFQSTDYTSAYGLEFSPDGSKLYINASAPARIYQIDMDNNYAVKLVGTSTYRNAGALQLGPDGKIYFAKYRSTSLGVITNPNAAGAACHYEDSGVFLAGRESYFGLPNFIQSYFHKPPFTYSQSCSGEKTFFSIPTNSSVKQLHWNFNDPYSRQNTSTELSPSHQFSKPGVYPIQLRIEYEDGISRTSTQKIIIKPQPIIDLGGPITLCEGQKHTLNAYFPKASYVWPDGSTKPDLIVEKAGIYWVDVSLEGCTLRDSVEVSYLSPLTINLGKDTTLCASTPFRLKVDQPGLNYLWPDGTAANEFTVTAPGIYWVKVSNGCQSFIDSIRISYTHAPVVNLGKDTTLCRGEVLKLNVRQPNASCRWQDGSEGLEFVVTGPGEYWVEVKNACGSTRSAIKVDYALPPMVHLGKNVALCPNEEVRLNAFLSGATYRWQNNSTQPEFIATKPGLYWVEMTTPCGVTRDSLQLFLRESPTLELGRDTILSENEILLLKMPPQFTAYRWQDGSTHSTYTISAPGTYWAEASSGCQYVRDSIQVTYQTCMASAIPNVITPNNDGLNDFFVITCMEGQRWELEIYNRWGKLVYRNKNYQNQWKADQLDGGVYYYVLKPVVTGGKSMQGTVHVLR